MDRGSRPPTSSVGVGAGVGLAGTAVGGGVGLDCWNRREARVGVGATGGEVVGTTVGSGCTVAPNQFVLGVGLGASVCTWADGVLVDRGVGSSVGPHPTISKVSSKNVTAKSDFTAIPLLRGKAAEIGQIIGRLLGRNP